MIKVTNIVKVKKYLKNTATVCNNYGN